MAHKHLHELLKEDQEPFQLKNYISEKRCQLKRVNIIPQTTLQIKKQKNPIIAQKSLASTKRSFCKHACFLSFQDSPDVRKSPFFEFPYSPVPKSPLTKNGVYLHVPSKTAALLFEAAMRVQTQKHAKEKIQLKSSGFGILGSILKKLKDRKTKPNETKSYPAKLKDQKTKLNEIKSYPAKFTRIISDVNVEELRISGCANDVSCYCNNSRLSSAGWSEKSLDLESSCSEQSEDSLEEAFAVYERRFCSTPLSPFRFSLHRSPSGHRTPEFSSPATSPGRENETKQEQTEGSNIVLEDEKEQCSPVSVLDTTFEVDDEDGQECGDEDEDEYEYDDDGDNECNRNYASVQKATEKLLDKLRRFEKLAELDPIELEKIMMEEMEEDEYQDDEAGSLGREIDNVDTVMLTEVLSQAGFHQSRKFPMQMERLVLDLISDEKKETNKFNDKEVMVRSICKKLNSWKEVQPHTIDMMLQFDFRRDYDSWKNHQEQSKEIAGEIEVAIFRVLVDELAEELCY
ncbi:hypothetical protein Leryth_008856 [Lithospermum erythrorhizon]|nr:hypothetical protein Leryth_008856 [Lithospermum erythrorhizon]